MLLSNIFARKAQGIFTAITTHYVPVMYPEANLADEEIEKKLRYVLQNRTVMWLAHETNRPFKDFLDIGKVTDVDLAELTLDTLADVHCTPEYIREWWHNGGRAWSYTHKEAVKKRAAEDLTAYVVRDDAKGMFLNLYAGDLSYVKSPKEVIGYDVNAPCVCEFSLKTIYERISCSKNLRVFTIKRSSILVVNTEGFSKEMVNSFRAVKIHEPPVNKASKK